MQRMSAIAVFVTALAVLAWAGPARGANPADVRRLLTTGACPGCDLSGADLRQTHLIGADLQKANLQGADLTEANLEGADLTGANLQGADLTEAFLSNAVLDYAVLSNANFTRVQMYNAHAYGTLNEGIELTGAQILGTPISVGGP